MSTRGFMTIAFGKERYIDMALSLGRSLKLNSPNIKRAVVTDSKSVALKNFYDFIIPLNHDYGKNVEQKLHIDKYSPFEETLFIDSDCLVFRDLEFAFDLFKGSKAIAIGTEFFFPNDTCVFADIKEVTQNLGIIKIPRFNGGIYYVSKSSIQQNILITARSFISNYKEQGFYSFREQGPADELLIGAAIELLGHGNISDNGLLMRTPIGIVGDLGVDVFKGYSKFNKSGHIVEPAIVHFAGNLVNLPEYKREIRKLDIYYESVFLKEIKVILYHKYFNLYQAIHIKRQYLWSKTPRLLRLVYHGLKSRI
ncbi:hypothetical protein N9459_06350 [Flavobacteriaceae bacterium]|nr:hypothetical protein [Flavobacteriaceae bacterium]